MLSSYCSEPLNWSVQVAFGECILIYTALKMAGNKVIKRYSVDLFRDIPKLKPENTRKRSVGPSAFKGLVSMWDLRV